MTIDQNRMIADRFLPAFLAGERAPSELYADAVTIWHNIGERSEQMAEPPSFGRARARIPDLRHEDVSMEVTEGGFVIRATTVGTAPDGAPIRVPACLVATVEDGRITRFDEYADSAAAAAFARAMTPPPARSPEVVPAFVTSLLDTLVERFSMEETPGDDGGPRLPLGPEGALGAFRLWTGKAIRRLVHVGVTMPGGAMEAHMLIAQTPADSAVPHLGVDVMRFPTGFAMFVDLLPRVDLAAYPAYGRAVYAGFDEIGRPLASLPRVPMPPSMLAFYSPWMLHHMNAETLDDTATIIRAYVDRFADLAEGGVDVDGLPEADALVARDTIHRGVLFDPDFDPVWKQVEPLLGAEAVTTIRETLGSPLA